MVSTKVSYFDSNVTRLPNVWGSHDGTIANDQVEIHDEVLTKGRSMSPYRPQS
jgi:hypothetical protein